MFKNIVETFLEIISPNFVKNKPVFYLRASLFLLHDQIDCVWENRFNITVFLYKISTNSIHIYLEISEWIS